MYIKVSLTLLTPSPLYLLSKVRTADCYAALTPKMAVDPNSIMHSIGSAASAVATLVTDNAPTIGAAATATAASFWSTTARDTCPSARAVSISTAASQTTEHDDHALKIADTESGSHENGETPPQAGIPTETAREGDDAVDPKKAAKLRTLKRSVMINAALYAGLEGANALVQWGFRQPQAP
jgi:hypothetical protein